ncbi:MAG: hypothetical protein GY947_16550 [Rhodobacteraceae bacterium]|nr:hypothetical protein [Paracoccaceae bacterium]
MEISSPPKMTVPPLGEGTASPSSELSSPPELLSPSALSPSALSPSALSPSALSESALTPESDESPPSPSSPPQAASTKLVANSIADHVRIIIPVRTVLVLMTHLPSSVFRPATVAEAGRRDRQNADGDLRDSRASAWCEVDNERTPMDSFQPLKPFVTALRSFKTTRKAHVAEPAARSNIRRLPGMAHRERRLAGLVRQRPTGNAQ